MIDTTEQQFDEPEFWSKIDRWISSGHFVLLNFEVGCAVDKITDFSVLVKLLQEFSSLQVISNLGKLEGDGTLSTSWIALELPRGIQDEARDVALRLASWLTISDDNYKDRLSKLTVTGSTKDERLEYLVL